MAYTRKVIAPEEIRRQEEICARIAARLRAEGERPLVSCSVRSEIVRAKSF